MNENKIVTKKLGRHGFIKTVPSMNIKTEDYEIIEGILTWINPELKEFTIPEGVVRVDIKEESKCKLEKIVFASTVTDICDYGLARFNNLKEIILNEGLEFIGSRAFLQTSISIIELPSTVRNVGPYAFYKCHNLEKVIINGELTYFCANVFENCNKLKELTLNMSLKFTPSLIKTLKDNNNIRTLNYQYMGKEISKGFAFSKLEKVNFIFNNNEELLKLFVSGELFDILKKFNNSHIDTTFIVKEQLKEKNILCPSDDVCSKLNSIYGKCDNSLILFNSVIKYILFSEQSDDRYKNLSIDKKVKGSLSHVAETIEGKTKVADVLSDIFEFCSKFRYNDMTYDPQVEKLYNIFNTAIEKLKKYNESYGRYIEMMDDVCFRYIDELLNKDTNSSKVLEEFWLAISDHVIKVYLEAEEAERNSVNEKINHIVRTRINKNND